jgi:hypothetical protein
VEQKLRPNVFHCYAKLYGSHRYWFPGGNASDAWPLLAAFRRPVLMNLDAAAVPQPQQRVVFEARRGSRVIVNQDSLRERVLNDPRLRSIVEFTCLSCLPVIEQARLVSSSVGLAGAHGGALAWVAFLPTESKRRCAVLEIFPRRALAQGTHALFDYLALSRINHVKHFRVHQQRDTPECRSKDWRSCGNMTVDVAQVTAVLHDVAEYVGGGAAGGAAGGDHPLAAPGAPPHEQPKGRQRATAHRPGAGSARVPDAAASLASSGYYLRYFPWSLDQEEGLDHQSASLSCALAEAFFLERTLVLPDHICIPPVHAVGCVQSTGHSGVACRAASLASAPPLQPPSSAVDAGYAPCAERDGEIQMPIDRLFDLRLLGSLVPIVRQSELLASVRSGASTTVVDYHWSSQRVKSSRSTSSATMLLRHTKRSWFNSCGATGVVNTSAILRRLGLLPPPAGYGHRPMVEHLLKSGLFLAPRLKAAASKIRAHLGADYATVHLRRGDRLAQYGGANLTEPEALLRAFAMWFPPETNVYVATDEKSTKRFFRPVQQQRPVYTSHNFSDIFRAHGAENNFEVYAIERLLFFGAAAHAETIPIAHEWFKQACFPAFAAVRRHEGSDRSSSASSSRARCGVSVHGVVYGDACSVSSSRPRCGAMHLLKPRPNPCARRPPMRRGECGEEEAARHTLI